MKRMGLFCHLFPKPIQIIKFFYVNKFYFRTWLESILSYTISCQEGLNKYPTNTQDKRPYLQYNNPKGHMDEGVYVQRRFKKSRRTSWLNLPVPERRTY
jgi:hypothetical protein